MKGTIRISVRGVSGLSFAGRDEPMAHAHSEVVINHNPACSTDDALLDAIQAHPILMERPVVVGPRGVRLCRPAERVQEVRPAR
jgi:ArsC family